MARISGANCGSTFAQTFSFDPFGNISKSGSFSWLPGYNQSTNRYTLAGTSYDANGNVLNETINPYTWDSDNGNWFVHLDTSNPFASPLFEHGFVDLFLGNTAYTVIPRPWP